MKPFYLVFCISLLTACVGPQQIATPPAENSVVRDGKLWSSLFQQRAAEYRALCNQAFNLARLRLDEALLQPSEKPRAIITDIDETLLDNSAYAVNRALQGKDYDSPSWLEWTAKGIADTLSGAFTFLNYAASKNIAVFYITNRKDAEREGTLKNLQLYNFPFADAEHLISRKDVSSKESRRMEVAAAYEVVLFLGDNLADFSKMFDGSLTTEQRISNVQRSASDYGKKFIILPNANYGGWEDAVYGYKFNLSPAQKDSAIKNNLKGY